MSKTESRFQKPAEEKTAPSQPNPTMSVAEFDYGVDMFGRKKMGSPPGVPRP